jgi:hypothetical protein
MTINRIDIPGKVPPGFGSTDGSEDSNQHTAEVSVTNELAQTVSIVNGLVVHWQYMSMVANFWEAAQFGLDPELREFLPLARAIGEQLAQVEEPALRTFRFDQAHDHENGDLLRIVVSDGVYTLSRECIEKADVRKKLPRTVKTTLYRSDGTPLKALDHTSIFSLQQLLMQKASGPTCPLLAPSISEEANFDPWDLFKGSGDFSMVEEWRKRRLLERAFAASWRNMFPPTGEEQTPTGVNLKPEQARQQYMKFLWANARWSFDSANNLELTVKSKTGWWERTIDFKKKVDFDRELLVGSQFSFCPDDDCEEIFGELERILRARFNL